MARLVERVRPAAWSEHLAFVRAGGIEIGHLAAPPRTSETVEGTLANLRRVETIVGVRPWLENVATLIDPPFSTMAEGAWTRAIVSDASAGLLLDLHNLYANAVNFGHDPFALLASMPLANVRCVHLSGGAWVRHAASASPRLLDDHLHDPPCIVYELLASLAERVPQPLLVIIERDGSYPDMSGLLAQVERARAAAASGRARARRWQREAA
jgi:hypothetical protein